MLSHFSHVQLFVSLWTVACQAFLSIGFSRQEYSSSLPCPLPGDLSDPGIKPTSLTPTLAGGLFTISTTWEAHSTVVHIYYLFNPCINGPMQFKLMLFKGQLYKQLNCNLTTSVKSQPLFFPNSFMPVLSPSRN